MLINLLGFNYKPYYYVSLFFIFSYDDKTTLLLLQLFIVGEYVKCQFM